MWLPRSGIPTSLCKQTAPNAQTIRNLPLLIIIQSPWDCQTTSTRRYYFPSDIKVLYLFTTPLATRSTPSSASMSPRQTRAARRAEAEQHVPIDTPSIVADESRPPSSLERKSARKPLKDIAGNVDESATRTSVGKKSNKGRKRTNAKKTAELQEDWVFEDQENGNEKDGSNSDGVEIEQQHVGNVEHKGVSQEEAGDEEEMDNGQEVAQEDAVLHLVKIEEVVIDVLEVTTPVEVCTDKQDDVELCKSLSNGLQTTFLL